MPVNIFDQGATLVPDLATEAGEPRILQRVADALWLDQGRRATLSCSTRSDLLRARTRLRPAVFDSTGALTARKRI